LPFEEKASLARERETKGGERQRDLIFYAIIKIFDI
jgi:hypothetical protein